MVVKSTSTGSLPRPSRVVPLNHMLTAPPSPFDPPAPFPRHVVLENAVVWNCVFYNLKHYQMSVLRDLPQMIYEAHMKVDPQTNIGAESIRKNLDSATKVRRGGCGAGTHYCSTRTVHGTNLEPNM